MPVAWAPAAAEEASVVAAAAAPAAEVDRLCVPPRRSCGTRLTASSHGRLPCPGSALVRLA